MFIVVYIVVVGLEIGFCRRDVREVVGLRRM